jgi:hypothetical protein
MPFGMPRTCNQNVTTVRDMKQNVAAAPAAAVRSMAGDAEHYARQQHRKVC